MLKTVTYDTETHVLVPIVPTRGMIESAWGNKEAYVEVLGKEYLKSASITYDSMINAAQEYPEDTKDQPVLFKNRLTEKQRIVFDFICGFNEKNKYPPTHQEIAFALGFKYTNSSNEYLIILERKGWIEVTKNISRGIRVLRRVPQKENEK